ncbi:MAG: HAMP domain-containing protein [Anaerolineae bacterium]|nr:HAMP domain-containing protein [Anaerolineae bacterium]
MAEEIRLYLEAHPELLDLPAEELQANQVLAAIAVQPVGETGYTAVYDRNGITHFHSNPAIVDVDLHTLAASLPSFWAILEASLDGTAVSGYYEWQDADGSIRDKFMSCVPVAGTGLRVAATTYIDEFQQPVRAIEEEIATITARVQRNLLIGLLVAGCIAAGLALWLSWGISQPVSRLIKAAATLEQGDYRPEEMAAETDRRDDLGQLARAFDRMAQEVQNRHENLSRQLDDLRIQIDEVKRAQHVAQITETEYFQYLQEKVRRMKRGQIEE